MRWGCIIAGLLLSAQVHAADSWQQVKEEAKGQTVWFNAWEAIRRSTGIWTGSAVK